MLLAGRIEELERQLARVGQILARHLLELVETAHRPVEVEREDEVAEDHVGAGLHQRLRHPEAVERADHQHALAAQLDPQRVCMNAIALRSSVFFSPLPSTTGVIFTASSSRSPSRSA